MNILTTRLLRYPDENGDDRELVLTVFMPFQAAEWRCGFVFGPPIDRKGVDLAGVDFIQALVSCLEVARAYLESTALSGRAHWQGMLDCGLPSFAERPAALHPASIPAPDGKAGDMNVLTTRRLGYPDENGIQRETILTVFVPFKAEGEVWKSGFTFGPSADAPIQYGVGADFLEALLDGLAMARTAFEGRVPKGWVPLGGLLDCTDLPYKDGRSFATDLVGELPPGSPDFFSR